MMYRSPKFLKNADPMKAPHSSTNLHDDELPAGSLTLLLREAVGCQASEAALYDRVEAHLRRRGRMLLTSQNPNIKTVELTELIDDAFMKLMRGGKRTWNDRRHFFRSATKAMRRLLVSHYRKEHARCRGGGLARQSLHDSVEDPKQSWAIQIVELDELLEPLRVEHSLAIEVLEHWAFSGWTHEEIETMLELKPRQAESLIKLARSLVQRQWKRSR